MIEEYNLSFLNLNTIKNKLLEIETSPHGLVTKGVSTYNHRMPTLMYPELTGLKNVIKQYVRLYCNKYEIPPLKFINSWFNISQPGNKLKAHKHEESIVSGAFYILGKSPLIFPDTQIQPYPGLLVIFSSDLVHYTEEEQEQRIVISFNTDYL
ncbi:MAG: hypothetical protein ACO22L_06350 [Candidatus Nanopelagicaceae bacterium]